MKPRVGDQHDHLKSKWIKVQSLFWWAENKLKRLPCSLLHRAKHKVAGAGFRGRDYMVCNSCGCHWFGGSL